MAWYSIGYYVLALVNAGVAIVKIHEMQPGWLASTFNLFTLAILFWCIGSGRLVWSGK